MAELFDPYDNVAAKKMKKKTIHLYQGPTGPYEELVLKEKLHYRAQSPAPPVSSADNAFSVKIFQGEAITLYTLSSRQFQLRKNKKPVRKKFFLPRGG